MKRPPNRKLLLAALALLAAAAGAAASRTAIGLDPDGDLPMSMFHRTAGERLQ